MNRTINLLKKAFADLFAPVIAIAVLITLVYYSKEVSSAVRAALVRCLDMVIPSLFAVMAVSQMLIRSRASRLAALPFYPVYKYILRLPPRLFTVFLMSSIGGYPVGIKLISGLLEQGRIDKKTAESLSAFCYCGGPAFYSGTVGLAVFSDVSIGVLIFLSVLSSNLLTALIICRSRKLTVRQEVSQEHFTADTFTDCVASAGRALFTVCAMIIFTSALLAVAEALKLFCIIGSLTGLSENGIVILKSFIEITYLTQLSGRPYYLLPVTAAACSFGGICIIIQLISLKSKELRLRAFMLTRPVNAALSALICRLLSPLFLPESLEVISSNKILVNFNNFVPSICLILMIFLLNLKKSLVFSE